MEKPNLGLWIATPESILEYGIPELKEKIEALNITMLTIRVKTRDGIYFDIPEKKKFANIFKVSLPIFHDYESLIPTLIVELRKTNKALQLYAGVDCFVDRNVKDSYRTRLQPSEGVDPDDSVCPNNEQYREYLLHLINHLMFTYDFDGIILERVRFFNKDACVCNTCKRSFKKATNTVPPRNLVGDMNSFTKWVDWRSQSISDFVELVNEKTKDARGKTRLGMVYNFDLAPGFETISQVLYGQNINELSRYIDFVVFDTVRPWSSLLLTNDTLSHLRLLLPYVIKTRFSGIETAFLLHKLSTDYFSKIYDLVKLCGIPEIFLYDRVLEEDSMEIIKQLQFR